MMDAATLRLVFFVTAASGTAVTHGANIHVDVQKLKPSGQVAYALFNSSSGFPSNKDQAFRKAFVDATIDSSTQSASMTIKDIPPGEYALILYQDMNQNLLLDKNFFGIPKEPVGASNNPTYRLGPPSFKSCKFLHAQSDTHLTIEMVE